jgi:hypothetical protein
MLSSKLTIGVHILTLLARISHQWNGIGLPSVS